MRRQRQVGVDLLGGLVEVLGDGDGLETGGVEHRRELGLLGARWADDDHVSVIAALHVDMQQVVRQGHGALELADAVVDACNDDNEFKFLYDLDLPVEKRIEKIAKEGASGQRKINQWTRLATVPIAARDSDCIKYRRNRSVTFLAPSS